MGIGRRILESFVGAPEPVEAEPRQFHSDAYMTFIDSMYGQAGNGQRTFMGERADALQLAAVKRGRDLVCNIGTLPLEAVDEANRLVRHPMLGRGRRIDPNVADVVTVAALVEDLLFDAVCWLRVTSRDFMGWPTAAARIDPSQVSFQQPDDYEEGWLPSGLPTEGHLWVAGKPVGFRDIIRIDSPNGPLLDTVRRIMVRAIALDAAAEMYANEPRAQGWFEPSDPAAGDPFSDDNGDLDSEKVTAWITEWRAARQTRSTAYIPGAVKYRESQQISPADLQLVQLQERVSLEVANAIGLDPELVGVSTTSRTYANVVDRRKDRINDLLAPYMSAITERLSMPDVTKRGVFVRFRLDEFLRADPKTRAEVQEIYLRTGVISREEVRALEGLAPGAPELPQEPRAAIQAGQAHVGEPMHQIAAGWEGYRFARTADLTFEDTERVTFAVDEERRTITGLALPWGQVARSQGRRWRFARGSVRYSDVSRVKLLRDHDNTAALGKAIDIQDTEAGLVITFKVSRGPSGDDALALAADGVLDGLSIGAEWLPEHFAPDPLNQGAYLVNQAALREVSLTAVPAFDDSRLTSVRASDRVEGGPAVPDQIDETTVAAEQPATETEAPANPVLFTAEQMRALMAGQFGAGIHPAPEQPAVISPVRPEETRPTAATFVAEPLPYRFHRDYSGPEVRLIADATTEHDFSADLYAVLGGRETGRDVSGALTRLNGMVRGTFAVTEANAAGVSPNRDMPGMWVPQMDYPTPLWDFINAGTTDGSKFDIPKFNSSSGLVAAATPGTEPAPGAFAVTTQTITPTQLWGKVEIERQAWRKPSSPALSGILWDQFLRAYFEGREAAVGTFLNTLTAAADIALTGTPAASPTNANDQTTVSDLERAIADLQFARGGNRFRAFAVHQDLFRVLARVKDGQGRPLYPIINPQNANGVSQSAFGTIDIAGTIAVPSYALGAGGQTTSQNSWLFDPAKVRGWASAPERLFWDFGATVQSNNVTQLAYVTVGLYSDIALGNTDLNGIRQVTFDASV